MQFCIGSLMHVDVCVKFSALILVIRNHIDPCLLTIFLYE